MNGWIGVDLDGTLATYDKWVDVAHIGEPIPAMVKRVKMWLAEGKDVRIFTARMAEPNEAALVKPIIQDWCRKHLGKALPVTCVKDMHCIVIWDDRAVQVQKNTGEPQLLITQRMIDQWAEILTNVRAYLGGNPDIALDERTKQVCDELKRTYGLLEQDKSYVFCHLCSRPFPRAAADNWGKEGNAGYWLDDAAVCPECEARQVPTVQKEV